MSDARQPKVDSLYFLAKLMLHSNTADRSSVQESRHLARQIWCRHRTLKEKKASLPVDVLKLREQTKAFLSDAGKPEVDFLHSWAMILPKFSGKSSL